MAERAVPDTVTSIGFALAEAAYRLTRFPAAVVVSDPTTQVASIVAASVGTDRRLLGRTVAPASAAGHACMETVTTYARDARELLGRTHADRRQREEHGIAMSLLDGRRRVGALIVFAPTDALAPWKQNQLVTLAGHAGHLIGKNLAVQLSQQLGLIDAITGQPNGPGLEKAMRDSVSKQCSLVSMAIDDVSAFGSKVVMDVLKQVAAIVRSSLRDYDVPARIERGEFALFLPDAPLDGAFIVADRVRTAVTQSPIDPGGKQALTCSLGVASIPHTVSKVDDLLEAAVDARKEGRASGRNSIATLHRI